MTRGEETDDEGTPRARSARRWSSLVGLAVGALGAAFVVRAFIRNWDDVSEVLIDARPGLVAVALILGGLGMTGVGLAWHIWLRVLGARLPLLSSLRGYFVGQLGKYVPGGVWAIMGRGEWARSAGVPRAVAYTSVLLSMGSAYLAALVLAAALVPVSDLLGSDGDRRYGLILLLLPLGFALLHPRVLRAILSALRRTSSRDVAVEVPTWMTSTLVVLQQIPSWLLIGTASLAIARGLGSSGDLVNVVLATTIAWVVGFLALPTPGGIGVREAVFVALATSLPTGIAAAVAVVARLVFMTVDALGAGLTGFLLARRDRKTKVVP